MTPDLSRLTDAERQVLRLLAQGHTAKSAATQLGLTEGAVNERLREARRKTGVGSSRELARQVGPHEPSQENRDEKIGVAEAPGAVVFVESSNWPTVIGVALMITLAAAVGAFAALAVYGQPASAPRVVQTSPAIGAKVAAGKITLQVTYDRPMKPSWSFVIARDRASFPDCAPTPVQSEDGRSFTLDCTVKAGKEYWIGFNSDRFRGFQSVTDVPATPATLRFSTR